MKPIQCSIVTTYGTLNQTTFWNLEEHCDCFIKLKFSSKQNQSKMCTIYEQANANLNPACFT